MSALLQVDELSVHARAQARTVLLEAVSFSLAAGDLLSLVGESGSGKSLLAQAIMGTLPADLQALGRIEIAGRVFQASQDRERRVLWGRQLAYLPQEPWAALDPTMTAVGQVSTSYRCVLGMASRRARARALRDLADVGLPDAAAKYPHQLSGGMAQRVAFAASVAAGASVLIVDEPTKGLDAALRRAIARQIGAHLTAGGAALLITHDTALARELGGRVAVMRQSRIVEFGAAHRVLEQPAAVYTQALLAAEPSRWPARTASPAGASDRLEPTRMLLTATGLTHRSASRTLFENLDLQLASGERVGIEGPSGAGKTTLSNILLGLVRPHAGRVSRSPVLGPHALQKLYQDPVAGFAPRLRLRDALQALIRRHRIGGQALAPLLDDLRLDHRLLDRWPDQVSGGELQRIALARLLLLRPALIVADEPTSRLDPISQQQTMRLLNAMLDQSGGALLLVSHDPDLVRNSTDRRIAIGASATAWSGPVPQPLLDDRGASRQAG